ncbi:hypothetical protein KXQ82_06710 [Mucilaginibacter sp. HMF5004]|uniref:hypothetical protein n=1 Tax=Mucilaginibacter rivuli TaxID=2857527 RepID=UPI001C5F981E|nr:hypothetical protein [Mucilaginibacter rivuli]MBW4889397.1 hypothetical protein [Mucilaginibacter rivuli]
MSATGKIPFATIRKHVSDYVNQHKITREQGHLDRLAYTIADYIGALHPGETISVQDVSKAISIVVR